MALNVKLATNITSAVFICLAVSGITNPCFADQGYRLIQDSDAHGDHIVLYLSKSSMRWKSKTLGMTIYTKAPWKEVFVCNDAKKLVFKCTPQSYQGHINYIATLSSGVVVQEVPMKFFKRGYLLRYPSSVYMLDKKKFDAEVGSRNFNDAQSINLLLPHIPRKLTSLLSKIYGVPDLAGVPANFGYVKARPSKQKMRKLQKRHPKIYLDLKKKGKLYETKLSTFLKTIRVDKVKMPVVLAAKPEGYKSVKVEQDLTRNPTAEAGMELMLQLRKK